MYIWLFRKCSHPYNYFNREAEKERNEVSTFCNNEWARLSLSFWCKYCSITHTIYVVVVYETWIKLFFRLPHTKLWYYSHFLKKPRERKLYRFRRVYIFLGSTKIWTIFSMPTSPVASLSVCLSAQFFLYGLSWPHMKLSRGLVLQMGQMDRTTQHKPKTILLSEIINITE